MTTEVINHCARHPSVETELACGKCGTYICPRCMVQTPVGARCKDCAQLRRPPMYTVDAVSMARIVGAVLILGGVVGLAWALLFPSGFGLLGFFLIFAGMFAGYGLANALDWASGRKRGVVVQSAAIATAVLAYLVHNVLASSTLFVLNDIWSLAFVGIAAAVAWGRLR
jgi:hypothetical protein